MVRPTKSRSVEYIPEVTYFKPRGVPLSSLEEVCLSVEELEAIRLKDLEDLDQAQAAERMNISRPTFQRVLGAARRKLAEALVDGKAIRVEGGHYDFPMTPRVFRCESCEHEWEEPFGTGRRGIDMACPECAGPVHRIDQHGHGGGRQPWGRHWADHGRNKQFSEGPSRGQLKHEEERRLKIAVVSEDGITVSQHFGRAPMYVVVEVQDGKVVGKETRAKLGHNHFAAHEASAENHGECHGYDAASQNKHTQMASAISDCEVLISGGMGWGAFDSLKSHGIEPIITDVALIDEAIQKYLDGTLENLQARLH